MFELRRRAQRVEASLGRGGPGLEAKPAGPRKRPRAHAPLEGRMTAYRNRRTWMIENGQYSPKHDEDMPQIRRKIR
jgi:hypothetical protein